MAKTPAKASDDAGAQVDRHVQDSRRLADRLQDDPAPQMYEFVDRLVNIALPRVAISAASADVRRWPRQLQHGHQGTDHLPGNRLRPGGCDARHDIAITTTARTDEEAKALLEHSASRSATDIRDTGMAKTNMVEREKSARRSSKVRDAPQGAQGDRAQPEVVTTTRWLRNKAAEAAARRQPDAPAQPLLADRPRAASMQVCALRRKLREATMRGDVPGLRKASW